MSDIHAPLIHSYDPAVGHGLANDPFKAIVAPRPIGWISTIDAQGRPNLAPYSFFNAISDGPPLLMLASNGWKDTLANAQATGVFTYNMATRALGAAMNATAAPVPHGENEFDLAGLRMLPGVRVAAPRVADTPAALECVVADIHRLRDKDGRDLERWMLIGQVVQVHIDSRYIVEGRFDLGAAGPILRAGYRDDYVEVTPDSLFQMRRPSR